MTPKPEEFRDPERMDDKDARDEFVRLRQRVQDLEDAQKPPGDSRPSERILQLERELQLSRQECADMRTSRDEWRELCELFRRTTA